MQGLWILRYHKNETEIACTSALTLNLICFFLQGCCQFCQKELSAFKETIMDTVSEVKKQVRKLKRTSSSGVVQPTLELTQLEKEWRKLIANSTSDAAAFY